MKWITRIAISNYRAFGEPVRIDIPQGHHLLVYGENGSGKSSLYHAVRDFFNSSFPVPPVDYTFNTFQVEAGNEQGEIRIGIDNNEPEYVWGSMHDAADLLSHMHPEIQRASKVKGFLDYKRLLPLYALNTPANQPFNIFDVLIRGLLADHLIPDPAGGTSTVELWPKYRELSDILCSKKSNSRAYQAAEEHLSVLNAELNELLRRVFERANLFLKEYFRNKLSLDLRPQPLGVFKPGEWQKKRMREEMYLRVQYAGKEIPNYHAFLNEARLSALSLCLFLASLKTYPYAAAQIRVLFLDDVFIGLDTSNRLPLLDILRSEFIQDEHPFQLFISTYDRQWFELARQWFTNTNCAVKAIELYIDDDGNPNTPDYPVIVDPSRDYFEKALAFFAMKDYPSAATHLRKACEQEIRRILPRHLTLQENKETGEVKRIDILDTLVNHLMEFLNKNGLDTTPFQEFQTLKKIVLNPLSHDDLEAPHFRREIEASIELVKHLKAIKAKTIVDLRAQQDRPLKLGCRQYNASKMYHYEFLLRENLQLLQQGTEAPVLSRVACTIREGGREISCKSLQEAFEKVWVERGYPDQVDFALFYENVSVTSHKKLKDLMELKNK